MGGCPRLEWNAPPALSSPDAVAILVHGISLPLHVTFAVTTMVRNDTIGPVEVMVDLHLTPAMKRFNP